MKSPRHEREELDPFNPKHRVLSDSAPKGDLVAGNDRGRDPGQGLGRLEGPPFDAHGVSVLEHQSDVTSASANGP